MNFRTRFAPSPTGPLHLGHAFSALLAHDMAVAAGGEFYLRMDDLDQSRSRPEWVDLIYDDLAWLGIRWPAPVLFQSARLPMYQAALRTLWNRGFLYPCTCTRRDIAEAASAPQEGAPLIGPDGLVYPGTCRHVPTGEMPEDMALRLNLTAVKGTRGDMRLSFTETGVTPGNVRFSLSDMQREIGDVVLARRDMGAAYHLAIVLDDAEQDITHVIRGQDLNEATKIHLLLQTLLDLPTPIYHHHRLVRDNTGKRLAKRDDARAIRLYREQGLTPGDVRRLVGL